MTIESLFFWIIIDPLTFILGSIGGYIIFHEVVDMDHIPKFKELAQIIKRRSLAFVSLSLSILYFFYRLITIVQNN